MSYLTRLKKFKTVASLRKHFMCVSPDTKLLIVNGGGFAGMETDGYGIHLSDLGEGDFKRVKEIINALRNPFHRVQRGTPSSSYSSLYMSDKNTPRDLFAPLYEGHTFISPPKIVEEAIDIIHEHGQYQLFR